MSSTPIRRQIIKFQLWLPHSKTHSQKASPIWWLNVIMAQIPCRLFPCDMHSLSLVNNQRSTRPTHPCVWHCCHYWWPHGRWMRMSLIQGKGWKPTTPRPLSPNVGEDTLLRGEGEHSEGIISQGELRSTIKLSLLNVKRMRVSIPPPLRSQHDQMQSSASATLSDTSWYEWLRDSQESSRVARGVPKSEPAALSLSSCISFISFNLFINKYLSPIYQIRPWRYSRDKNQSSSLATWGIWSSGGDEEELLKCIIE